MKKFEKHTLRVKKIIIIIIRKNKNCCTFERKIWLYVEKQRQGFLDYKYTLQIQKMNWMVNFTIQIWQGDILFEKKFLTCSKILTFNFFLFESRSVSALLH